ncbi:helicase-associated domain-containing protein, partial [Streptomyces hainanensis]
MSPISASSPSPSGLPLSAWLGRLPADRLRALLAARPDTLQPYAPNDLGELATRLLDKASVARAVSRLPLRCLQAAEALAALGAIGRGAARERLAGLLRGGTAEGARGLDLALTELTGHGLAWQDEDGLWHLAEPVAATWPAPLGLGPGLVELLGEKTTDELCGMADALGITPPDTRQRRLEALRDHHTDPERVRAVVAAAPAASRELLLQHSRAVLTEPVPSSLPGLRWALDRGLLLRARYGQVPAHLPAEVALILRGPGWRAPFDAVPPAPPLVAAPAEAVTQEASAAAYAFLDRAAAVLAECAARPPERRKSGGVGPRELLRLGRAAHCEEPDVRLALELGRAAGLLCRDEDRFPATAAYDAWLAGEPGQRAAALLRAWRAVPATPTRTRDREGRTLPALLELPPRRDVPIARRTLLNAASRLPAGEGAASPGALAALVAWHRPLAARLDEDAPPFATLLAEATRIGVLAHGALTPLGAALLGAEDEEVVAAARRLLPAATERARIGGDLTAVVAGAPSAPLETTLEAVADRESRGAASVWRFTPGSIRRGLDAGDSADSIEADLVAINGGPLPQPLRYLIRDTARRHGQLRVVSPACVIHAPEPALLTEIIYHRKLAPLGLRQLAPTVLVSRTPAPETLAALRTAGYAPVTEAVDGLVQVERTERPQAAVSESIGSLTGIGCTGRCPGGAASVPSLSPAPRWVRAPNGST